MIYSDPINFTTTANQPLLVSFQLQNSTPTVPSHTWPTDGGAEWVSAGGSGDLSADTTGTPFTASGSAEWASTSIVTGLEVSTPKTPTQAVVGDGFIDQAESGGTRPLASTNLADDLTATESTTPSPYGSIAEGIEANELTVDFPKPAMVAARLPCPASTATSSTNRVSPPLFSTKDWKTFWPTARPLPA